MPHPLSPLGIAHTAISLLPVVAGLYSFIRYRAIDTGRRSGQVYLAGLAVSVFTAFGLSSSGGFNPGHALGILALLAAFGSLLVTRLSFLGRLRPYLATFGLSFSFFLTMIPGTVETLTRLPVAHPLASGPESPIVRMTLLVWVVSLLLGFALQARAIRLRHRQAAGN
ncbi:hypothetical protein [Undibacterium sp. Tian12W]|uniref:hypothetical protein n=1 Tax=Undibacterium sp. Tian12W TaxID=3413054 RepID=UPI003BF3A899